MAVKEVTCFYRQIFCELDLDSLTKPVLVGGILSGTGLRFLQAVSSDLVT